MSYLGCNVTRVGKHYKVTERNEDGTYTLEGTNIQETLSNVELPQIWVIQHPAKAPKHKYTIRQ
jgi:hypothetical protein